MSVYKLARCHCGGEVELCPSKPWQQDPVITCKRCGGRWKYGTYSNEKTVEKWNKEHGIGTHNPFANLHPAEIPTRKREYKFKRYKKAEISLDNVVVDLNTKPSIKLDRVIKIELDYLIDNNGNMENRHLTINSPGKISINSNLAKMLEEAERSGECFVIDQKARIEFGDSNLCELKKE